jgi:hypothetical protein
VGGGARDLGERVRSLGVVVSISTYQNLESVYSSYDSDIASLRLRAVPRSLDRLDANAASLVDRRCLGSWGLRRS